jgi:hypothetical protein
MVGINFSFVRSSLCLVLFSVDGRNGLALQVVNGEACIVLVNEYCIPIDIDMTLLVMRLIKNSLTTFYVALNLSNIHARGWKSSGLRSNLDTAIGYREIVK